MAAIQSIETISQAHALLGMPKPKHPLVSVFYHRDGTSMENLKGYSFTSGLYYIALKDGIAGSLKYGRNSYDFQEGTIVFIGPHQVVSFDDVELSEASTGWTLLFHPDLIRRSTELGNRMEDYSFFSYDVHEALHLSEEEKLFLTELVHKIKKEYEQFIDRHSQELIIASIELILKYCQRYYDRQFYTRTNLNKDYIIRVEQFLKNYFASDSLQTHGIPTVTQIGKALNMSGHYLSDLLKAETGKSAKEHIHLYLVEKAKAILLQSRGSVSEIAYELGFDYPQHFSKLFKAKTGLTPSEFRKGA